jgi:hypothetical protein
MNTGVEVFEPLSRNNNNGFCFSSPGTLMQELLDTLTPHTKRTTILCLSLGATGSAGACFGKLKALERPARAPPQ